MVFSKPKWKSLEVPCFAVILLLSGIKLESRTISSLASDSYQHFFEYDVKNKRNGMRKEALPGAQKLFILPWKIPRFMFSGKNFLFTNARNSLIFSYDILDWFKIGFKKDFDKIAFILPFEQNWSYIIANFFLKYNPLFISYWPEVWLSYDK